MCDANWRALKALAGLDRERNEKNRDVPCWDAMHRRLTKEVGSLANRQRLQVMEVRRYGRQLARELSWYEMRGWGL